MEPESPEEARRRKINEAVESGNHELKEMARLAYNRGDKELARDIWRSLTDKGGSDQREERENTHNQSAEKNKNTEDGEMLDKDMQLAREAAQASADADQERHLSKPAEADRVQSTTVAAENPADNPTISIESSGGTDTGGSVDTQTGSTGALPDSGGPAGSGSGGVIG